jgi:hypothetical protein
MDETYVLINIICLGVLTLAALIREVLLKKERDEWKRRFDRRNRDNGEWL